MEFLNQKATEIFTQLINTLRDGHYHKIYNEPFMPLSIEKIAEAIETPWGKADLYSLCHYYEQNGDLMQDPEMCFIMVGHRHGTDTGLDKVQVAPYSFQQANLAIYEESVRWEGSTLSEVRKPMQAAHAEFANQWLCNIEEQGFLKV